MPHQTFFNLPEEKRQQILQVALDEFAENDYDNVSISRMVTRAGIAKGSFYQYFADKEDLYAYLLEMLTDAKREFMSLDHPDPTHIGIFAYLRWMAEAGLAFQLAHPQLSKLAVRATNANFFPKAFDMSAREQTQEFYRRLVAVGQQQGDIAPDVDPQVAAIIFDGSLTSVSRYLLDKIARGEIVLKLDGENLFDLPEVKVIFNTAVDLVEHGMRGTGRRLESRHDSTANGAGQEASRDDSRQEMRSVNE